MIIGFFLKHVDCEKKLFSIDCIDFCLCIDNRSAAPTPPYPVLPNVMTASTDSLRQQQQQSDKHVKVLHAYDAQHHDELTIRPGKIYIDFV
jgi:hypothetical protein